VGRGGARPAEQPSTLGEKATPEGDKILADIGRFLPVSVEKMQAVVYETDPQGVALSDLEPSDPRMTVQFLLRAG